MRVRYADLIANTRKTVWYAFLGTTPMVSADTEAACRKAWETYGRIYKEAPRILAITLAPDGHFPLTTPWAGGTWGGGCGSSMWLDDPGFFPERRDFDYGTVQAWYENSRSKDPTMRERFPTPTPGYRVSCQGRFRHLGKCHYDQGKFIHIEWNPYESIQYEPMVLDLVP